MAIKVSNTTVINNDRKMLNITDTDGRVSYSAVQAALTPTSSNINFTTPKMSCTLAADTTFTESGAAEGKSAQLLLDLSSSGHTPTFSSNINWANGTEPTWSGYQKWHIIFTCVSATEIRAVAFGYEAQSGGTPTSWPAGTAFAAVNPNLTGYADDHESGNLGNGPVTATSRCRVNFYLKSGGGCEMYFVPTGTGGASPYYKNTSNATVNVTSGSSTKIWEESTVTPDSVRLVTYTQYGTLAADTGYVTPSGVGTGTTESIFCSRTQASTGTTATSVQGTMDAWVRKSGYADTKVASWKFITEVYVSASGCFTGDAELYTWNPETETVYKQMMSDAYNDYRANYSTQENKTKYVIGQNNEIKEILAFNKLELDETLYGINGSTPFVSGGHPFLTSDGWKCIDLTKGTVDYPDLGLTQLNVGDTLKKYNEDTDTYYDEEITDITGTELEIDAYLLDVSGDDTYIVNGHIVHNK